MTEVLAAHPETAALFLDFDGCLAPVVVDPAVAAPPPETLAVLERLVEGLTLVGIVSGRPVDFLVHAVPLPESSSSVSTGWSAASTAAR